MGEAQKGLPMTPRERAEALNNQLIFGIRYEERLAFIESALKAERAEECEAILARAKCAADAETFFDWLAARLKEGRG
jgi:hypothetical protein